MAYDYETQARGDSHGWDAADYANAYGSDETPTEEATRRGQEYAAVEPSFDVSAYVTGFLNGWERFELEMADDDV